MDIPDPEPFGQIASASGEGFAVLGLDGSHELGDRDRVRVRGADDKAVECYVKRIAADALALYADSNLSQPIPIGRVAPGSGAVRLAAEDWAVVVAINHYFYKGLRTLHGPQRDAHLFAEWVKEGACVPEDQVLRVPACETDPGSEGEAVPTSDAVTNVFLDLLRAAMGKPNLRLGRRLYLFLAGHGIVPLRSDTPDYQEAALLMANASDLTFSRHIGARSHAEYFRGRGIFDEVVLFVDCCRDLKNNIALTPPQLPPIAGQRSAGRRFYAAPTQLGSKAWEQPFDKPCEVRGIFSYALIEGLNDPALCDDRGYLTGSKLAEYLYVKIPELTDKQNPAIDWNPGEPEIVFLKRHNPKRPQAHIAFAPAYAGKTAQLYLGSDTRNAIDQSKIEPDEIWKVSVGVNRLYKVAVDGTASAALFEATEAITNVRIP